MNYILLNTLREVAQDANKVICTATIDRDNHGDGCTEMYGRLCRIYRLPGNGDYVKECRPVMEVRGRITLEGEEPGLGQGVKYRNQLLVGTNQA